MEGNTGAAARDLIFDMGGVIVRFEPELFVRRLGLDEADSLLLLREVYRGPEWPALDRGALTDREAIEAASRRLPSRLRRYVPALVSRWDEPPLSVEGMDALLGELSAAGVGLYLLSNAAKRHHSYWPRYPEARHFGDRVLISADVALLKPDRRIYEEALRRFGLRRESCLFIDDVAANVDGARAAGIDALRFENAAQLRAALADRGILRSAESE